jgi:hypothetical protein
VVGDGGGVQGGGGGGGVGGGVGWVDHVVILVFDFKNYVIRIMS